jgi:hypothetical protein
LFGSLSSTHGGIAFGHHPIYSPFTFNEKAKLETPRHVFGKDLGDIYNFSKKFRFQRIPIENEDSQEETQFIFYSKLKD